MGNNTARRKKPKHLCVFPHRSSRVWFAPFSAPSFFVFLVPARCEPVWGCVYTGAAHTLCCQTTAGSFILASAKWEVSFRSGINPFPSGEPGGCAKVTAPGALML